MTDAIDYEEYDKVVAEYATINVEEAEAAVEEGRRDDAHQTMIEYVQEDVQHQDWFAGSYYGGSLYGSIVEHSDADVGRYSDWQALIETNEPEETLKRLALVCFEADVLARAQGLLDADDDE